MTNEEKERFERDKRITEMIQSSDPEMFKLGMATLQRFYPAVWSGLVNLSGIGEVTDDVLHTIASFPEVQIGGNVRYRGLPGSPVMVVVSSEVKKHNSAKVPTYCVYITGKWFNKSKQEFQTTTDRVEAFEVAEFTKKEEET